jgi:hypothetical protein
MRMDVRVLLVVVTTAALLAGVIPASAAEVAATRSHPTPSSEAAQASMTHITLRVIACRHCPVYLQQAITGGTYWGSKTHHVRNGRVRFTVPTTRTRGMSFNVNPRWSTADAVTNVVTRYAHTQIGQLIKDKVARHKKRATACWRGTSAHRIFMIVRVVKFRHKDHDGNPGHALRAYFRTTRAATPPVTRTWHGALGNQDAYWCDA